MAKKENVDLPASKQVKSILEILKDQGYIDNFKLIEDKKQGYLRVYLKYTLGKSAIRNIERVSKPGLRKYVGSKEIPDVLRGRGISIVSTSKGITTGDEARKMNLGGEILCFVW